MKVSELMVGDWVNTTPRKKNPTYGKITAIIDNKIIIDGNVYLGNSISPIVMTPELLEKIGFRRRNKKPGSCDEFLWDMETDEFGISVNLEKNERNEQYVIVVNENESKTMEYDFDNELHLHMFQNILRMMDIMDMMVDELDVEQENG